MTPRKTFHLSTSGTGLSSSATDDIGNDETDITIILDDSILDVDKVDGEHASAFVHKSGAETITGLKTFEAAIIMDGAATNAKRIYFDAVDLSFDRNLGFNFSYGGKSVIQATTGDFLWQTTVSAAWKTVFEIKTADGVMDFNEVPTVDGTDIELTGHTHLRADLPSEIAFEDEANTFSFSHFLYIYVSFIRCILVPKLFCLLPGSTQPFHYTLLEIIFISV